jgi:hypothetical protein
MSDSETTAVAEATPTVKKARRSASKAAKSVKKKIRPKKKKSSKKASSGSHDGSAVGIKAKSKQDVPWSKNKVAFYKALKRCNGGAGTSSEIASKSNGAINEGHARHFGYHGVGGGLVAIEEIEGVRGYSFKLTAKGRSLDPDAELKKQKEAKEKAKAKAKA